MSWPGFSEIYRSAGTRARVAIALLAITGLISILTAFHNASGFDLIRSAEEGTLATGEADRFDQTTQALAGAYLLAFVGTAIAYLAWLSRTVDNVPKLTGAIPMVTPRWSIGWWFIPFANLIKPYQIVRDLNSSLATESNGGGNGMVVAWWLVWIGGGIIGTVVSRLPAPVSLDDLSGWFTVNLILEVVGVAAAVLAILVVRQIQARADERAANIKEAAPVLDTSDGAPGALAPCPRCGARREPGQQFCPTCGVDLWAAYDESHTGRASADD